MQDLKEILDLAVGSNTLFVGISTTFPSLRSFGKNVTDLNKNVLHTLIENPEIVDFVKEKNPNIKFVLGGAFTKLELRLKPLSFIEYVVSGYAEKSIVNLANHLKNGEPLLHSHRDILTKRIHIEDKIAEGYDFTNCTMRWLDIDIVNHTKLPIEIARGCIFKCKFCSYPLNGKKKLDYIRNIDIIIDELKYNYENYGVKEYNIIDDTFNDSVEKLELLAEAISKLEFQPLFWCYTRLDLLSTKPNMIDLMHRIGVREMLFGIETLNQQAGKTVGKGYSSDKLKQTLVKIKREYPEILLRGSFIVGLPGETKKSFSDTIRYVLSKDCPLDSIALYPMSLYKYEIDNMSEMDRDYEKYGFKEVEPLEDYPQYINWVSDEFTYIEAMQMVNVLYLSVGQTGHPEKLRLEDVPKNEFIISYKRKLLDMVRSNL